MTPMPGQPPVYTLADTWLLNSRVNLKLLDHLGEEQLAVKPNPRARSIADQFAHLHNVRIMIVLHLKHAGKPVDRMFGFSLWEWEKI